MIAAVYFAITSSTLEAAFHRRRHIPAVYSLCDLSTHTRVLYRQQDHRVHTCSFEGQRSEESTAVKSIWGFPHGGWAHPCTQFDWARYRETSRFILIQFAELLEEIINIEILLKKITSWQSKRKLTASRVGFNLLHILQSKPTNYNMSQIFTTA